MNQKGFTLIELLVTITILGIITVVALPQITRTSVGNLEKKYQAYLENVEYTGKIYNDSYAEDLFGDKPNGCKIIKYNEMVDKKLLKDIQIKDKSCNTDDTFVVVIKNKDKYYTKAYIGCGDKTASGVKNIKLIPSERTGIEACLETQNVNMSIDVAPKEYREVDKKNLDIQITVTSATGIDPRGNQSVQYGFITKMSTTPSISWANANLTSIPSKGNQLNLIKSGSFPRAHATVNLNGQTGMFYLAVKANTIYDMYGDSYNNGNIMYFGPYTIDNKAPIFESDSGIVRGSSKNKPKLNLNVHDIDGEENLTEDEYEDIVADPDEVDDEEEDDDVEEDTSGDEVEEEIEDGSEEEFSANEDGDQETEDDPGVSKPEEAAYDDENGKQHDESQIPVESIPEVSEVLNIGTPQEELKMCVKYNSQCTASDHYETYNPTKELPEVTANTTRIYITVVDKAGNRSTNSYNFEKDNTPEKVYVTYNCKGKGIAPARKECIKGQACELSTAKCNKKCKSSQASGWYTKDGKSKYGKKPKFTANTTVYAKWTKKCKTVVIKFNRNGSKGKDVTKTCTIKGKATSCKIKTPSISRDGWTKIGWGKKSTAKTKSLKTKTTYKFKKSKTYYAITKKQIKASFNYAISKEKNLNNLYTGSHPKSKSCYRWNKNTTCSVQTPTCDFGKSHNSHHIALNRYFTCNWKAGNKTVSSTKKAAIGSNTTFNLSAKAKGKYMNNGKLSLSSRPYSTNVCVRGNTQKVYNYGVSPSTLDGSYSEKTKFDWTGDWIIDKDEGFLWFYGTGRSKGTDCTTVKNSSLCSNSRKAKMTNWISARLTYIN